MGMTQNGLAAGYFNSGTGFAYDVATSNYYTFGPTNSWVQAVGGSTAGNGYVVGGDGANFDGFVWSESNQSYVQIPALAAAQGISNNGQLVAGLNPRAAITRRRSIPPRERSVGTYWAGEATGVNNNGLVIGDNSNDVYNGAGAWNNCQAMAYFPGYGSVNLNVFAPNGVTFNTAQAVNDAGQILVCSDSEEVFTPNATSYLLTPAIARRRQSRRPSRHQRLDHRAGALRPDRHELGTGRVHRRRHGGHQRLDHRAGALQPKRSVRRPPAWLPCRSPARWPCSRRGWPVCWPMPHGGAGSPQYSRCRTSRCRAQNTSPKRKRG